MARARARASPRARVIFCLCTLLLSLLIKSLSPTQVKGIKIISFKKNNFSKTMGFELNIVFI